MKTAIQKIKIWGIIILPLLFIMASCEKTLVGPEKSNTPTANFDFFWKTFDEHYGMFEVKNVDWDALYRRYRPRVNDQMTDEALYHVMADLIIQLNDNHLNIYPTNGVLPAFPGGVLRYKNRELTILKIQEDYDWEVSKKYLVESEEITPSVKFGTLPGNIGYISIEGHNDSRKSVEKSMEKMVGQLQSSKALIIDVRGDYGGMDAIAQLMAGHFASSKKLYMTSRKRNGIKHTDFTTPTEWYVEPTGTTFTKNIVVLTSRFTQSAGETFTLAMKEFEHVKVLGDTTAGSYSDNPNFELPNGWIFSVSVGDYRASDGNSYEGKGTAPNSWSRTTREELLAGKDSTLEKAIQMLQ